jgi:large subunit ribosomal protein L22
MATEIVAKGKYIRGSAQKARIPARVVKGMLALEAIDVLKYNPKKAAHDIRKVVKSALANAKHNHGLQEELMYVEDVRVDKAPPMRRFKVNSRGAGYNRIMKHNSHITVVLQSLEDMIEETQEKKVEKNEKTQKPKKNTAKKEQSETKEKKTTKKVPKENTKTKSKTKKATKTVKTSKAKKSTKSKKIVNKSKK